MILVFVHGDLRAGVPSGSAWVLGPTLLADAAHNVPTLPTVPNVATYIAITVMEHWAGSVMIMPEKGCKP